MSSKSKGRRLALLAGVLGVGVVAVTMFSFRERLVEEWYIHKLKSGDAQEREQAADRLAKVGLARSIPVLLQALKQQCRILGFIYYEDQFSTGVHQISLLPQQEAAARAITRALFAISDSSGRAAIPPLREGLEFDETKVVCKVLIEVATGKGAVPPMGLPNKR